MLRKGSSGYFVQLIQWSLDINPADGEFAHNTELAIKEFQHTHGLAPDGIVGPKTISALGINLFEEGLSDFQIRLNKSKLENASISDIPKLVNAVIPLFKKNNHVQEHLHKGLELGFHYAEELHLDTPEGLSHFFGQIRQEVGPNFITKENLNYKCSSLIELFSYYKINPGQANKHGRCNNHPANPEEIANHAYANRYDNGDIDSGDGWKYRGRGCKQLTFKSNYQNFQNYMDEHFPKVTKDFMNNPDLLEQPGYALLSGAIFWKENKIHKKAEKGIDENISNEVTKIINYYTSPTSYDYRWKYTKQAANLLGVIS